MTCNLNTHDTSICELDDHQRSRLGHSKVPSPLCGSGSSKTIVSGSNISAKNYISDCLDLPIVENLGADDPRKRTDRETVRDDEEVNHAGHCDTSRRHGLCIGVRLVGVEDGSDDEEEHAHQPDSNSKRHLSTKSLDSDGNEDGGGDDLDDTVDSRGKQTRSGALETDGLEDNGSVIRDTVCMSLAMSYLNEIWTHSVRTIAEE